MLALGNPTRMRDARRFKRHRPPGDPYELAADHTAVISARTIFRARVKHATGDEPLLKSGAHNRKIGAVVAKGRWTGMPIYTLTLEERATCPATCAHWLDCYGNKMNWSVRWRHGPAFERLLGIELRQLAMQHPSGFVVRLHVLGDFYSVEYCEKWAAWLTELPSLRLFGYTARVRDSDIGRAVAALGWERAAIRFSDQMIDEPSTVTLYQYARGRTKLGVVCPAQTDDADCCATCGLCWHSKGRVVFLAH